MSLYDDIYQLEYGERELEALLPKVRELREKLTPLIKEIGAVVCGNTCYWVEHGSLQRIAFRHASALNDLAAADSSTANSGACPSTSTPRESGQSSAVTAVAANTQAVS